MDCFDPATKTSTKKTFGECFKGSVAFLQDNEVKFFFFYPTAAEAAKQIVNFTGMTFIDLAELSAVQQRPVRGTAYDAVAKTFKETEGIIIPIWVTQNALVNGWAVAGTPAAVPAPAAAATTVAPTTESATAEAAESVKAFFKNDLRDFLLAFIGSLIDFKFDWIIIDAKKILILLNW